MLACPWPKDDMRTTKSNDCQQDKLIIYRTSHDSVTGADLPVIGPIADLPEFHDCQRLLVPYERKGSASAPAADSLSFGPLVAIWAANKLDSAFQQSASRDMAVPVAVIYNFERQTEYAPLHIKPGFSCLYLWKDSGWQARLLPVGPHVPPDTGPTQCLHPVPTSGSDTPGWVALDVIDTPLPPGLRPEDIPAVTRWDWESKQQLQYIGIRCGDQWCSVGPKGFHTSAPASDTPAGAAVLAMVENINIPGFEQATPDEMTRIISIKGWYDEQRLDLWEPNLVLTDITGTAFPHPALERVKAGMFQGAWIPSAYLQVSGDYPGKVPLKAGITRVYLCEGAANQCKGAETVGTCAAKYQDPHEVWWAKMISPSGETSFHCVMRRMHGGRAIPAAATRWNWSEFDAKTWIACGQGCCVGN
jgi:hypothetical protein